MLKPYTISVLFLLFFTSICGHQELQASPVWMDAPHVPVTIFTAAQYDEDSSTVTIPFSRAGNLILVKGRADTTEGNFVLDTGCPGLVLNLTYFRHYPQQHDASVEQQGITGAVEGGIRVRIADFSFGDKHYYQADADLVNLGHIENAKGVKVLGLIGMQLLEQYEMIVDFGKSLIHLHRVGRKEAKTYRHPMLENISEYETVPVELISSRLVVKGTVAGKRVRLIIDSGAEINILDSRLPDAVFELVTITNRTLLNGVGSAKVEAVQGQLETMEIGGQQLKQMPVLVTNLERTCFANGGCADGVIGFDLLANRKIGFNFVTKKMFIWK